MNILITGGAGFIGSQVTRSLHARGHQVTVVDSLDPVVHKTLPDLPRVQFTAKRYGSTGLYPLYGEQWDTVIHLAAQVSVAESMKNPYPFVEQNTMDTCQLLAMLTNTDRLVVASSMSVYGDPGTSNPVDEEVRPDPASVYGLTKLDQEKLCLMNPRGISTVALRFFNVYGQGQALHNPYTGVLANFANQILNGEQPTVYEDGQQTRDFVSVFDVAKAVVAAAVDDFDPGVYNVCTGTPTTIERIAQLLAEGLDSDLTPNITGEVRPGDIRHCIGNPAKLAGQMAWEPMGVEAGIKQYGRWLKKQEGA